MNEERDPEVVAFERAVRRDATIHRIQAIYRMSALRGSPRSWWAVRAFLRSRREEKQ